ncbi:MAG: hypothetical protein L3J09_05540 [Flavobacteriaceae bacterium]|nr:hypothetical protein [Flavobacteriaceae bacterium]
MHDQNNIIQKFSEHLFWDVDKSLIDPIQNSKYIVNSVMQYGFFKDWKLLNTLYTLDTIVEIAANNKSLDKKSASFLALISNTSTSIFLCYTTKQSIPRHWNF